jgi:hypothetical protein
MYGLVLFEAAGQTVPEQSDISLAQPSPSLKGMCASTAEEDQPWPDGHVHDHFLGKQ